MMFNVRLRAYYILKKKFRVRHLYSLGAAQALPSPDLPTLPVVSTNFLAERGEAADSRRRGQAEKMSYLLPHLHSGWAVDQAILAEEERLVMIRFGHDWDETCMQVPTVYETLAV
jgi:hypothetical protein